MSTEHSDATEGKSPPPRRRSGLQRARRSLGRGAERAVTALVNGLDWSLRAPEAVVDRTPWTPILQRDKLTLRRYHAPEVEDWGLGAAVEAPARLRTPVLLVPPLMIKPFIFDLTAERSLVRTLLAAGLDVMVIDFGEPDAQDEHIRLDDYVLDWLPAAVEAACAASGSDKVALAGYCMGGLFALMYAAAHGDERVAAIVAIASPIDSAKMGVLSLLSKRLAGQIDFVSRRLGNVPGELSSQVFKMMNPWKSATRHADVFKHLDDQAWLDGFDALDAWTSNFLDYPGDAFRQLMQEFMRDNKLKDGRMTLGNHIADLRTVRAPVLAFAGKTDTVVRPAAVRELLDAVGSDDKQVLLVPGGHMGVFAGSAAPKAVWAPMSSWLVQRLREQP